MAARHLDVKTRLQGRGRLRRWRWRCRARFMGRLSWGQKRASQVLRRRFVILRLAAAELEQFERKSDALWARLEALRGTVRTF